MPSKFLWIMANYILIDFGPFFGRHISSHSPAFFIPLQDKALSFGIAIWNTTAYMMTFGKSESIIRNNGLRVVVSKFITQI